MICTVVLLLCQSETAESVTNWLKKNSENLVAHETEKSKGGIGFQISYRLLGTGLARFTAVFPQAVIFLGFHFTTSLGSIPGKLHGFPFHPKIPREASFARVAKKVLSKGYQNLVAIGGGLLLSCLYSCH